MKVIRSIKTMQNICSSLKNRRTIALVPTMGYLHEGHLSLIKLAKKTADVTIATIFVNPKQFGKNEDFSRYPRDEKGDLRKLKTLGVDYVFIPNEKKIYPPDHQTSVEISKISKLLCGRSRPGHFTGVATVVIKLFNIIQPDYSIFGQKDYQQLAVIKTMVKDLNLPVKIICSKIIRENDGLAMSSRNAYLNKSERILAPCLYKGLRKVKRACLNGSVSVNKMRQIFLTQIPKNKRVRVDYIECLNTNNLSPIKMYAKKDTLVAAAVFIGKTRLIDNIII